MRGLRTVGLVARAGRPRAFGDSTEGVYGGIYRPAAYTPRQIMTAAHTHPADTTASETSPDAKASKPTLKPSPDTTAPKPYRKRRADTDTTLPLSERFRHLMRLVPQPVVVCTALHPGDTPTPRAMTVSSLTSLSLDPSPLLCFNMKKPSRTLDAVLASGRFNVHVLAGGSRGVRVAERFAKGDGKRDLFKRPFPEDGSSIEEWEDEVVLKGRGIRKIAKCRVERTVDVRDHVLIIGEVEGIEKEGAAVGLVYADGAYREVGKVKKRHSTGEMKNRKKKDSSELE